MTLSVSARAPASCIDSPSQSVDACVSPATVCSEAENPCPREGQRAPPAPTVPWGLRFCREADTVVEGFLCDERVVVSNACREPKNALDAYVCDEPRMHALQNDIVRRTLSILKTLFSQLMRG
jgi:hypothetical protein